MPKLPRIAPPSGKCCSTEGVQKILISFREVASTPLVITLPYALPTLGSVGKDPMASVLQECLRCPFSWPLGPAAHLP